MREATIKIGYPGSVVSVNHYLGRRKDGGTYVKREAQYFMAEIGWLVKPYHIEDWALPLEVWCYGKFKDKRSTPDLSNLSKCVLDAIEETTGINDRFMMWHDGASVLKADEEPELLIIIKESSHVK